MNDALGQPCDVWFGNSDDMARDRDSSDDDDADFRVCRAVDCHEELDDLDGPYCFTCERARRESRQSW